MIKIISFSIPHTKILFQDKSARVVSSCLCVILAFVFLMPQKVMKHLKEVFKTATIL